MTLKLMPSPIAELPFARTPLVGRIAERETARTLLLDDAVPIVTITGPAGVGKTRLSLAIAREVASSFADGTSFVDLTTVRERSLVLPAIAQVLGLRPHGDQAPSVAVGAFLKVRQILLVLDNFEQVLSAAPDIAVLLASCPALQVLATSRAPLRIRGEHLLRVPPLSLPVGDDIVDIVTLRHADAVALFVQRARAANPQFALTESNAATVTDICRRVDGLPLALELAAARLRHLSVEELLTRLAQRLGVLIGGERDAPIRQRTLRDAITWSYDLLTIDERTLFERCAVFVGGFDLDAASAVAAGDVSILLGTLVDHNLVQRHERPDGTVRFGLLETVRESALEHLALSGKLAAAQRVHAAYFFGLAARAEVDMYLANPRRALDDLEVEYPNCRAALDYFAASRDADSELWLASWMAEFWQNRGRLAEGIPYLSDALERGQNAAPIPRAKAMIDLSLLVREVGDCGRALDLAAEAERLARTGSDEGRLAQVLFVRAGTIGSCLQAWGDVVPLLEEVLDRVTAVDPESPLRPATLADLGWALTRLGEIARGRRMIEEAMSIARTRNRGFSFTKHLTTLGLLDHESGDALGAADSYRRALELCGEIGFTMRAVYPLAGLAGLAMDRRNPGLAARLLGMIEAVWLQAGTGSTTPRLEKWQTIADHTRRQSLALLGTEEFSVRVAASRTLPVATVFAEAISIAGAINAGKIAGPSPVPAQNPLPPMRIPSSRPAEELSRREREVLTLLVRRWTAPEIAEWLSLSERTAESHVASIYNKLGVSCRRDAVAAAIGYGLIESLAPDPMA